MTVRYGAVTFDWLGHASVRLEGRTGAVIYIDPEGEAFGEGADPSDADLVLVTHSHHYDPEAIRRVAREGAFVVVHDAVEANDHERTNERPEALPYEVERVRADESFVLGPLDLFTTPAYNEPDGPNTHADGTPVHPEGSGCGYAVTIDGVRAFWPGDTDYIDAHDELDIDIVFPPIGGAGTMDRHEAATMADRIDPGLVCPIQFGGPRTSESEPDAFVVDIATRGVPVVLDDRTRAGRD